MAALMCCVGFCQYMREAGLHQDSIAASADAAAANEQVKKISITFEGEVIIGLSLEILHQVTGFWDLTLFSLYLFIKQIRNIVLYIESRQKHDVCSFFTL